MPSRSTRVYYLVLSAVLLGVEICIGAYAHGWVRDSLGDILVIPLLYCLVRIFLPKALPRTMPLVMCGIGFAAEIAQYFRFYEILGFEKGSLGAIILGTGFSWNDMLCYLTGTILIYLGMSLRGFLQNRKDVQS